MRVRWTTEAADDLERICDYIAKDRPSAAPTVARTVVEGIGSLEVFPHRGRPGRVDATRELVFSPLPFVAVYEIIDDQVQVLRVLHGAQQWPSPR